MRNGLSVKLKHVALTETSGCDKKLVLRETVYIESHSRDSEGVDSFIDIHTHRIMRKTDVFLTNLRTLRLLNPVMKAITVSCTRYKVEGPTRYHISSFVSKSREKNVIFICWVSKRYWP